MIDVSVDAFLARRHKLQKRAEEAGRAALWRSGKKATAKQVFREIRSYLIKCYDAAPRLICEPPELVHKRLLLMGPHPKLEESTATIVVGETANFREDPSRPHLTRERDGWWFDFRLTLREARDELEIMAYAFELRAPKEAVSAPFPFVRFDLNGPGHDNEESGLRSHLHLGTDEDSYLVPAPIMTPFELLDLMVHGIGVKGRGREARKLESTEAGSDDGLAPS